MHIVKSLLPNQKNRVITLTLRFKDNLKIKLKKWHVVFLFNV